MKKLTITIATMIILVMFGCSAMMDAVTPCYIEPEAAEYADANSTGFLPFTTLFDAYRIDNKMDYIHERKQLDYARLAEDDTLKYGHLKNTHTVNIQGGLDFQQTAFTPEGPIGLLLPTLAGGTLGALLIKRPGDTKKNKTT